MPLISQMPLVPGRDCGSCSVCCVALTVNDGGLFKPQGHRCPNLTATDRCAIYADRPKDCGDFYCGFRRLKWVRDTLHPALSGVLIILGYTDPARWEVGLSVMLLTPQALDAEGLAETIAFAVVMDMPVDLVVPGPPGYTSGWTRIKTALTQIVLQNDMDAVRGELRRVRDSLVSGADHQPLKP
jgi:hypothetical protein